MSAVALARRPGARLRAVDGARLAEAVALLALMAASLALRLRAGASRLWMDEAISVGIASHPLTEIPGALRLDGSPPLYYLLLHLWMSVAGSSAEATHALSAAFAVLCVPAGWWAGLVAGDRRTGWATAVLVACSPFVTRYAGDARMYTLVVLLGLVCVGCFAGAYVRGRRGYDVGFGVALALLLYTHDWALFLGIALALAFAVIAGTAPRERRRRLMRGGALGFGIAGLLYLPWLPSAVFQARHTGAPWASAPGVADLARVPADLLGSRPAALTVAIVAGTGLVGLVARSTRRPRALVAALGLLATVPLLVGWLMSPAWAPRYLAIVAAPAMLLAGLGLGATRRAAIPALAIVAVLWATVTPPPHGGNIVGIARAARPFVHRGDLVVSAAPGQVPLLAYYLPHDVRFASPFGATADPGVMDWRDALEHLERTSVSGQLMPLLAGARPGSELVLVVPLARDAAAWQTPWGRRVMRRAAQYERTLLHDRRLRLIAHLPAQPDHAPDASTFAGLVFRKRTSPSPSRGNAVRRADVPTRR